MSRLVGKTALVTGGGIGIGRQIVMDLARQGARVAFTYLTHPPEPEFLDALAATNAPAGLAMQLDVTDEAAVIDGVAEISGKLGGFDILVNNAGGLIARVPLSEMSTEHWRTVMALNLDSTFTVTREVIRTMHVGGRIVNISSIAAQNGGSDGSGAYAAAKAGVIGFTRSLAKELAPRQITVNTVTPGLILDTPFHQTHSTPEKQQATIGGIPLGRAGDPKDVAGPVVWLCSEESAFVTGAVVDINGGSYFT